MTATKFTIANNNSKKIILSFITEDGKKFKSFILDVNKNVSSLNKSTSKLTATLESQISLYDLEYVLLAIGDIYLNYDEIMGYYHEIDWGYMEIQGCSTMNDVGWCVGKLYKGSGYGSKAGCYLGGFIPCLFWWTIDCLIASCATN